MTIALLAKNKIGFIDCSCTKPETDSSLIKQSEDAMPPNVLSWIMNLVSKKLFGEIV